MAVRAGRFLCLCVLFFLVSTTFLQSGDCKQKLPKPCMNLALYIHDILYNGSNAHNATAAAVGQPPQAANFSNVFGKTIVFDDQLTLDNNLHSPPAGRAQGMYFYDSQATATAWFGFTMVLNSTNYKGTITLAGADSLNDKYRYFTVLGGTGDFLMARGIATVTTDAVEGIVYYRLLFNITLYECYSPSH